MAVAAPKVAYWGAASIYAATAAIASFAVLWLPDPADSSMMWMRGPHTNLLCSAAAAVSAAAASLLLHPLFRRLAAHRFFLRPIILGLLVAIVAHVLFPLTTAFSLEVWAALTRGFSGREIERFWAGVFIVGSLGFIIAFSVTLPLGVLAAYCVEILDWSCGVAQMRRQRNQPPDDPQVPVE